MKITASTPIRLAIVTHVVQKSDGQGRVNYEIAKTALERGHSVTIIGESCSDEISRHSRGEFVCFKTRLIPSRLLKNLYFAWKSWKWLTVHASEFDVVQANGFVTWATCNVVSAHFVHSSWLMNPYYPYKGFLVNPYAWYQRLYTQLNARWERKAFRKAEVVVAVSRTTAEQVHALGVPTEKIKVVHNGVDSAEFYPGRSTRSAFGLPEEVILALFVGDIRTPRKNLKTVLEALRQLDGLHLAVAGETAGSPYPQLSVSLGLGERVHFMGKTKEIPALMRSSDLFIFPSHYEAHPLVVLEAMASGLPVIVSSNFGASDFLGGGGFIMEDPDDVDALSARINQLMASKKDRVRLGIQARQSALELSWLKTAEGYIRLYEERSNRVS